MRTPGVVPEDESNRLLLHVARTVWESAPQQLLMSLALLVAALPGLVLATVAPWAVAWPLLALGIGPVWIAVAAASDRLLVGDGVGARDFLAQVARHGPAGFRIAVVPAMVGAVLLATWRILDQGDGAAWIAIPFLLDLGVALVVALALVPVFTLALDGRVRGLDLWLAAAGFAFAQPVPVAGTTTLFGLVLWAGAILGPAALLPVAPVILLATAVVRAVILPGNGPLDVDAP